ncbi:MAG TPA: MlaD family protein [Desulfomicrobiaceae bacterium]|nr:MlaD family protein [Desulfomicrobiaceae bacterium]
MASNRTKFSVGLFMAGGMALAVVGIIWLGMTSMFENGHLYVTYFDESVQGLDVDAPVKYRGVPVGRVDSIGVAPDGRLVQVVLSVDVDPKAVNAKGNNVTAKLAAVGITGSMFVELDRREEPPLSRPLEFSFTPDHPVIRSEPSNISRLLGGIDDVFSRFRTMDIEGTLARVDTALDVLTASISDARIRELSLEFEAVLKGMDAIVNASEWQSILRHADRAGKGIDTAMNLAAQDLKKAGAVVDRVDALIAATSPDLIRTASALRRSAEKGESVLDTTDTTVRTGKEAVQDLHHNLRATIQGLQTSVENLNRLSETLADTPSRLLFGSPPAPRSLPED